MNNQEAAHLINEYLQEHYYRIDEDWFDALFAAHTVLTRPHEYVVQLENGGFLLTGDDLYIFPTLEAVDSAVREYASFQGFLPGGAVVNLFQIIQARWDNGEPLTEGDEQHD